jgi:hypothetical protein
MRLCTDGRFRVPGDPTAMFTVAAAGRRYLGLAGPGILGARAYQIVFAQRLQPNGPATGAWQRRAGHTWLLVNGLPTFFSLDFARGPVLQIDEIPGAPGYLAVTTLDYGTQPVDAARDDDVATMFLQVPKAYGRDLEDAVIEHRGTEDWVRWSGGLFRPADGVPALAAGENTVTLGSEGYGEWRRVPAATTLRIAAGATWLLYDKEFSPAGRGFALPAVVQAPAGSWLLLYGPAGGSQVVTVY